jgi:hypothetical protein
LDEAGHPGGSARTQQHQITRSRANHRITRFSVAGRSVVKFCGFPTFDDHAVIVYVKYCKQTTYVNIQDVRNQEFFFDNFRSPIRQTVERRRPRLRRSDQLGRGGLTLSS